MFVRRLCRRKWLIVSTAVKSADVTGIAGKRVDTLRQNLFSCLDTGKIHLQVVRLLLKPEGSGEKLFPLVHQRGVDLVRQDLSTIKENAFRALIFRSNVAIRRNACIAGYEIDIPWLIVDFKPSKMVCYENAPIGRQLDRRHSVIKPFVVLLAVKSGHDALDCWDRRGGVPGIAAAAFR